MPHSAIYRESSPVRKAAISRNGVMRRVRPDLVSQMA